MQIVSPDASLYRSLADHAYRFRPDVKVSFLTQELSFGEDQLCAQFICDCGGDELLENRGDGVRFLSGKGAQLFEAAKQKAFRGIDIKGQI